MTLLNEIWSQTLLLRTCAANIKAKPRTAEEAMGEAPVGVSNARLAETWSGDNLNGVAAGRVADVLGFS